MAEFAFSVAKEFWEFSAILKIAITPLIHNVPKWSETL